MIIIYGGIQPGSVDILNTIWEIQSREFLILKSIPNEVMHFLPLAQNNLSFSPFIELKRLLVLFFKNNFRRPRPLQAQGPHQHDGPEQQKISEQDCDVARRGFNDNVDDSSDTAQDSREVLAAQQVGTSRPRNKNKKQRKVDPDILNRLG
jgi:hypothetical protein